MKISLPCIIGVCAALTAVTANAQQSRFYVRGDVGAQLTSDTDLEEFFGPVAGGSDVEFDTGIRLGIAGGYQVTDWFAAEVESAIMASELKSITGANDVDAVFSNVPFLINARFQLPNRSPLTPYIGAGVGFSVASLDVERINLNGLSIDGYESDAVFACQAFAGLRYALNDQMGLSLEYHYFATDEPSWDADYISGKIGFGRMETHALSVAFDYKF